MRNHTLRILALSFAVSLVLSCTSIARAQSGRHVRQPAPAPAPSPEPTPGSNKSSEKPKPRLTLIIGIDRSGYVGNIPLYAYSGVLRTVVDRLDDDPSVKVETANDDMTRGEAVKRAKAEASSYVVYLGLAPDMQDSNNSGSLNNLYVEYMVVAPTTAKIIATGRTYAAVYRNRRLPDPRNGGLYGDYYLNQAARAAAERILSALGKNAAPDTRY